MTQRDLEKKREQIKQECVRRGLRISPYGTGFWIDGNGVSIVCADLATLSGRELEPAHKSFVR